MSSEGQRVGHKEKKTQSGREGGGGEGGSRRCMDEAWPPAEGSRVLNQTEINV